MNRFILWVGVVVILVFMVISVTFFPKQLSSQSVIIIPVDPTSAYLKNRLNEKETIYKKQVATIEQNLWQQNVDFQDNIELLSKQITVTQKQLDNMKNQQKKLLLQIEQLETKHTKQLKTHQAEIEHAQESYSIRQAQLQIKLNQTQSQLILVNNQSNK